MSPQEDERAKYRQAALAYGLLGMAVVLLVTLDPTLAVAQRREDLLRLWIGLGFVALFAGLVGWGQRVIGRVAHRWLVRVLTILQVVRMLVFGANAVGYRPRLHDGFALETVEPRPKFWLAALLMAAIAAMLARASWSPRSPSSTRDR